MSNKDRFEFGELVEKMSEYLDNVKTKAIPGEMIVSIPQYREIGKLMGLTEKQIEEDLEKMQTYEFEDTLSEL
jgi:hypothetical protein